MKSEKFTPIAPTEEQKAYEKLAKEEASNLNSGFENLVGSITGKGFNKEDIMRVDAKTENKLRDKGYCDASEKLKKIENSTLEYSRTEIGDEVHYVLSGRINGHNVIVKKINRYFIPIQTTSKIMSSYNGTIDGLELSEEEAYKIYSEYSNIAEDRTNKIISAKNKPEIEKQNIIKKEKEKADAIAKEEAGAKTKEDAVTKEKADEERAILLKDLGF